MSGLQLFALARQTWRATLSPRRAIPIAVVALPMLIAESGYGRAHAMIATMIVIGFIGSAPLTWRACHRRFSSAHPLIGLLSFAAMSALLIVALGALTPKLLGLHQSFLTSPWNLLIGWALFSVGGWGLGRDIELELELEQAKWRTLELERAAQDAQLMAIKANLDPHFLFNTLNAIAEWCQEDPVVAEDALLKLSALLRAVFEGISLPRWELKQEMKMIRDLLALYAVRDPARYAAMLELDASLERALIPPMLLLPLVENALKHGQSAGHQGRLNLKISPEPGADGQPWIRIMIENPGPFLGLRPGGQGISMVQRRLALAYGDAASLSLTDHQDHTTTLCRLPVAPSAP